MNFKELCEQRYSVRSYLPQAVEREKIEYILNCARLAPSACNYQPWIFYVVETPEAKAKVLESYNREWFAKAPVYLVVCKNNKRAWKRRNSDNKSFGDIDAAIAAEHICIAAHEQGLGTCWVCNYVPELLKEALKIEDEDIEPIVIFSLGYVDNKNTERKEKVRKSLDEVTQWI